MKRPEKRSCELCEMPYTDCGCAIHNLCHDAHTEWLPSIRELNTILWEAINNWQDTHGESQQGMIWHEAEMIATRLGVKE